MARIKAKKREIYDGYPLQHKCDKTPSKFQEIEKYLDFLANITQECTDIRINKYGNDKKCVWILYGKIKGEYVALQVGEVGVERAVKEIEYSNAIVHAFQKFGAPFSGKIVHIFPEQSAVI